MAASKFLPLNTSDNDSYVFNNLRYLTISDIENIIDSSRSGRISRLQLLFDLVEQSSLTLALCISRRTSALPDWVIKPRKIRGNASIDNDLQAAQIQYLNDQFSRCEDSGTLRKAIFNLAMASFRGLGVCQPVYDSKDNLDYIISLDPWNFAISTKKNRLGEYPLYWNPTGTDVIDAKMQLPEIPFEQVIVNYNRIPIDAFALRYYLMENLGIDSYTKLISRKGLPATYVVAPEELASDDLNNWATKAVECAKGGSGAFPFGTNILTQNIDPSNGSSIEQFLDYTQRQIVLASTGGTLASLTSPTGMNSNVAEVQNDVFKSIVANDAFVIADLINRSIVRKLLDNAFPGKPHLAYFDLDYDVSIKPSDILNDAVLAKNAGYMMDEKELSEKTGYTLTREATQVWTPPSSFNSKEDTYEVPIVKNEEEQLPGNPNQEDQIEVLKGFDKFLAPLKKLFIKLLHLKDGESDEKLIKEIEDEIIAMQSSTDNDFSKAVEKLWQDTIENDLTEEDK